MQMLDTFSEGFKSANRSVFIDSYTNYPGFPMKGRGEYDAFVNAHDILLFSGIHGEFFLPWHRDFVNNLELGLRNNGEFDVAIPYWNWEETPEVPTELAELGRIWGLALPNNSRIDWEKFHKIESTASLASVGSLWPMSQEAGFKLVAMILTQLALRRNEQPVRSGVQRVGG